MELAQLPIRHARAFEGAGIFGDLIAWMGHVLLLFLRRNPS
jgi:hypothetical protein